MLWLWTREAGPAGIGLCLAVPQPGHTRGTAPAFHIWFDLAVFIKKQTVVFFLLHSPQLYSKQLPPSSAACDILTHQRCSSEELGSAAGVWNCRSCGCQGHGCSWLCQAQGAGLWGHGLG